MVLEGIKKRIQEAQAPYREERTEEGPGIRERAKTYFEKREKTYEAKQEVREAKQAIEEERRFQKYKTEEIPKLQLRGAYAEEAQVQEEKLIKAERTHAEYLGARREREKAEWAAKHPTISAAKASTKEFLRARLKEEAVVEKRAKEGISKYARDMKHKRGGTISNKIYARDMKHKRGGTISNKMKEPRMGAGETALSPTTGQRRYQTGLSTGIMSEPVGYSGLSAGLREEAYRPRAPQDLLGQPKVSLLMNGKQQDLIGNGRRQEMSMLGNGKQMDFIGNGKRKEISLFGNGKQMDFGTGKKKKERHY